MDGDVVVVFESMTTMMDDADNWALSNKQGVKAVPSSRRAQSITGNGCVRRGVLERHAKQPA